MVHSTRVASSILGYSPTFRLPTLVLLLLTLLNSEVSAGPSPSLMGRLFEIGCEFSGVVTRVRRSAPNPPPEEPNFDDPEELFNYLYPLADVKPGDDHLGSQRSNYGTHSLSSWMEDLMELWHSECQHKRKKRSAERREAYNKRASGGESWSTQTHRMRGRVDRTRLASALGGKNSSLLGSSLSKTMNERRGDNYYDGGEITTDQNYAQQFGNDGKESGNGDYYSYGGGAAMDHTGSNNDNYEDYWKNGPLEDIIGKEEEKFEDKKKPDATTAAPTTAAPAGPLIPIPTAPPEDIFFAQYGGDIEYFFPLLSFGIPFDGEITLLGFHGFHGLFPY